MVTYMIIIITLCKPFNMQTKKTLRNLKMLPALKVVWSISLVSMIKYRLERR